MSTTRTAMPEGADAVIALYREGGLTRDAAATDLVLLGCNAERTALELALVDFDARYRVEPNGERGYVVADTVERKIEAGPMRYRSDAVSVLVFMRQHVGVTVTTWAPKVESE